MKMEIDTDIRKSFYKLFITAVLIQYVQGEFEARASWFAGTEGAQKILYFANQSFQRFEFTFKILPIKVKEYRRQIWPGKLSRNLRKIPNQRDRRIFQIVQHQSRKTYPSH